MGNEDAMLEALPLRSNNQRRTQQYQQAWQRIQLLVEGEDDLVAVMATVSCELHHAFAYYSWTGFYRLREPSETTLVIGPYQGTHGCLRIPIGKGVCGVAAQTRQTQLVPDVHAFPGHIACASSTKSEIVVPILSGNGDLLGVLDVDSNGQDAFTAQDQTGLEMVASVFHNWTQNADGKVAYARPSITAAS